MKTSWAIPYGSLQQNREQHTSKDSARCAENEPNHAHGDLSSRVSGVDAIGELIASPAPKGLSLGGSI
jgi:hypothetical protein